MIFLIFAVLAVVCAAPTTNKDLSSGQRGFQEVEVIKSIYISGSYKYVAPNGQEYSVSYAVPPESYTGAIADADPAYVLGLSPDTFASLLEFHPSQDIFGPPATIEGGVSGFGVSVDSQALNPNVVKSLIG